MKNRKNNIFIIIIVIIFVLLAIFAIVNLSRGNKGGDTAQVEEEYEKNKSEIDISGIDNVDVNSDGTTTNTSLDLKKDKTVAGLVISSVTVNYLGQTTEIRGVIKNNTSAEINADLVNMQVLDSKGNVFREIEVYIGKVKAGATKALEVSTQADISNMKDLRFTK